jgi:hypothetical protein
MSIAFTGTNSGLTRSGAFLPNDGAGWTRLGWFAPINATPGTGQSRTYYNYGDIAYSTPYIWMGSNKGVNDVMLEIYDGVNFFDSPAIPLTLNEWFSWAIVFDTVSVKFYINGALVWTQTINLSLITFTHTDEFIAKDGSSGVSDIAVAYVGEWNVQFALGNLLQQWPLTTYKITSSIQAYTPLTSPADLADSSGKGRPWSVSGTAGTTYASPLPPNTVIGGAIDLGTLPATYTQRADVGGVAPELYYKYTSPVKAILNFWGYSDLALSGHYCPIAYVYLGPQITTNYMGVHDSIGGGTLSDPIQFPVNAGETYYFRLIPYYVAITTTPAYANISLLQFSPLAVAPAESIAINDDSGHLARGDGTFDNFPLSLLSTTENYKALKYIYSMPAGENGDALNNGTSMIGNDGDGGPLKLYFYDFAFNLIASTPIPTPSIYLRDARANRFNNKFYFLYQVASSGGHWKIGRASALGVIEFSTSQISNAPNISSICTSPDGSIAYLFNSANDATGGISRWDMVNDLPLSQIVSIPGASWARNAVCLQDGSVVGTLQGTIGEIRRYSATGVLLNTYTPASLGINHLNSTDARLAQTIDGMTFWHRNTDNARLPGSPVGNPARDGIFFGYFIKVDAVTGAVIKRIFHQNYSVGTFFGDYITPAEVPTRFGYSESCTFWILAVGTDGAPAAPVGTGKITVTKATSPPSQKDEIFNFTATGLTPTTFSLKSGQSVLFDNLPPGTYSIGELSNPNYDSVLTPSNGNPANAIVLGTGDSVTVTVTNTFKGPFSGIYYIKPGKTNDTLWTAIATPGDDTGAKQVVAIPNPFWIH